MEGDEFWGIPSILAPSRHHSRPQHSVHQIYFPFALKGKQASNCKQDLRVGWNMEHRPGTLPNSGLESLCPRPEPRAAPERGRARPS